MIAAVALGLAWRLFGSLSLEELAERIGNAQPSLLALGAAALIGRWAAWQSRWGVNLTAAGHRVPTLERGAALLAAVFVNHVALRFFGIVFRARYLAARTGRAFATHLAVVLVDQATHHGATGIYTLLCGSYVAFRLGWRLIGFGLLALLILALVALPLILSQHHRARALAGWLAQRAERKQHGAGVLEGSAELPRLFGDLLAQPRRVARCFGLTFLLIGANVFGQWLLFRALGIELPLVLVAAVTGLGTLAGTISGLPGGLGPMEVALVSGYELLGVGRADALAGVLLFRGLHYLLVLALGLPAFLALELGGNGRTRDSEGQSRALDDQP